MKIKKENINVAVKTMFFAVAIFGILILGRDLLPSQQETFKFHDMTQFARIEEFSSAIRTLQIPPVYAKNMNFGLGYPMFLFYAPVAYIIGSFIHLAGIPTIDSVKITFFVLWLVGMAGMHTFIKQKTKDSYAGIISALLYASSPWWASEIFVRGNLATSAFLAFAPWSLWAVFSYWRYPIRSLLFIMLTTLSHNALSIIIIPILLAYSFFASYKNRAQRIMFVTLSILSSSWFWIPAISQMSLTYAQEVATMTKYSDHFLCLDQIWSAGFWGYGGSLKGCADGMSFMLGKIQILVFVAGTIFALWKYKVKSLIYFEILTVLWLVFMTLPDSQFVWNVVTPIHSMQFPWRFLAIVLIFVISVGSHFFHFIFDITHFVLERYLKNIVDIESAKYILSICMIFITVLGSAKFFMGQKVSKSDLDKNYLSKKYISNSAAHEAPEYLPKSVNRDFWLTLRDKNITPENKAMLKSQMDKFSPNPELRLLGFLVSAVSIYFALWPYHTKKTLS